MEGKKLNIGQTVLYRLTKSERAAANYDVLPATVLYVNQDGSANIEVHGADGLYLEEVPHGSTVQDVSKDGTFVLSGEQF